MTNIVSLPGLIDCHVHFRPAPGDDWDVGSVAAAHAGLTTLIPFGAYNADDKETLPQALPCHFVSALPIVDRPCVLTLQIGQ